MTDASRRQRTLRSLLDSVARANVRRSPFAHFALEHTFPTDVYDEMRAQLPADGAYWPDNPTKYRLPDGTIARGTLPLREVPEGPIWRDVDAALRSPELRARVLALLAGDLSRRFRVAPEDIASIPAYPSTLLVRDRPGYWIEPHPDSRAKVVTLQFYLPCDASQSSLGTSLYRLRPWRIGNWLATGRPFEEFHRFRFVPNAGYGFAVGPFSWHGVERMPTDSGLRDSVMVIYYRDPVRARS